MPFVILTLVTTHKTYFLRMFNVLRKQVKNNSLMAHIQLFLWTAHLSFPFRYGGKSKTAYINAKEG